VPTTWAGVDKQIQQAAPQTRLLVARVTGGGCQTVHAVDATTPAPLGSAFKLYVLDALARAIAAGTVSWDQRLTLTSQLTSLLVGRTAVESAAAAAGMADPALDTPFLTTRELFVLKLDDWPGLASRYLALDAAGRPAMLAGTVDRVPLSALHVTAPTGWTQPRDISTIEWFASPADICRVYASLAALSRQPGLAPVASILAINNGSLNLDPRQWSTVWFKGGSEPGVLTLNYLATTRTGQSYVVSALAANPSAPIPATATAQLIGAIKGAFTLAAG
jgi:hypothetical protein